MSRPRDTRALVDTLKRPVRLALQVIPAGRLLAREQGASFLPLALRALAAAEPAPEFTVCVTTPPAPEPRQRRVPAEVREAQETLAALEPYLRTLPRVERRAGQELVLELRHGPCGDPAPAAETPAETIPPAAASGEAEAVP